MDSSPESQPEKVTIPATDKAELKDRKLSNKGQFTIPQDALFDTEIQHKDTGIFLIKDIPFTATIYTSGHGIRATVNSSVRKALNLDKGDTTDITLLRILKKQSHGSSSDS